MKRLLIFFFQTVTSCPSHFNSFPILSLSFFHFLSFSSLPSSLSLSLFLSLSILSHSLVHLSRSWTMKRGKKLKIVNCCPSLYGHHLLLRRFFSFRFHLLTSLSPLPFTLPPFPFTHYLTFHSFQRRNGWTFLLQNLTLLLYWSLLCPVFVFHSTLPPYHFASRNVFFFHLFSLLPLSLS